jgi:two-component system, NarL family, response regulator LiaR
MSIKEKKAYSGDKKLKPISILIADDHPLMRKAMRMTLEKEPDFNVIGEAKDGLQAIEMARDLKPDVVILDISMPNLNGAQAAKKMKENNPDLAILVLTVHDDMQFLLGMLNAGANGYLTKDISDTELVNSVRRSVADEIVIAPQLLSLLIDYASKHSEKSLVWEARDKFSVREIDILKLTAKGLNNRSIALQLNLSPFTVKTYMAEIFSKLGVSSRTEAVVEAVQRGLISIEDTKHKQIQ